MNRSPKSADSVSVPGKQQPFRANAFGGWPIHGFEWRHPSGGGDQRPVVIVNSATSVLCQYYFGFAEFLHESGFDVLVYDYRGIGVSRPAGSLRDFEISWLDWGRLDFEAVLNFAAHAFPGQPVDVVAHSVGGVLLGLAPSNHRIRRVFSVGAQYAYWRDYRRDRRFAMLWKWHVFMPLLTLVVGYFPGRRLGWLEDTPKGVVRDWVLSRRRFEETWRGRAARRHPHPKTLVEQFSRLSAPMLAVSVTDDEFGTVSAIERLLTYFSSSPRIHLRIPPRSIGEPRIGHFGFFHSRYRQKLWPIAAQWLQTGRLTKNLSGTIVPRS